MDRHLFEFRLSEIRKLIEELGDVSKASELLDPLLVKRDPEALYWRSTFSLKEQETAAEFESRRIRMLMESAISDFPPALFALGVMFQSGDTVPKDEVRSSFYFRNAAIGGWPEAKFRHGLNLFYGSNGINKDEVLGLALIEEAARDGVEAAKDRLDELRSGFR